MERDVNKNVKHNMTSKRWSPVACWLYLTQYKYLTNIMYSQALSMLQSKCKMEMYEFILPKLF